MVGKIQNITKRAFHLMLCLLLISISSIPFIQKTNSAGALSAITILPSDGRPSATTVSYAVTFTFASTSTSITCIQTKFATGTNMATPATGMTSGTGTSLSGGGLTTGNWSNYGTVNGTLQTQYASGQTPTSSPITITWTGVQNTSITNPTNVYAQITTYSTGTNGSCSGVVDQSPVMALVYTSGLSATVGIDPSLTFNVANYGSAVNSSTASAFVTTTSSTIPFGTVAPGSFASGSQTLTTSTNAKNGYNIYVLYSGPLTDANSDTIADTTGTNAAPAAFSGTGTTSAFGYTTDGPGTAARFTSNTWAKLSTTALSIATRSAPISNDVTHIEYRVQPANTQQPGSYSTTVSYIAAPTY